MASIAADIAETPRQPDGENTVNRWDWLSVQMNEWRNK